MPSIFQKAINFMGKTNCKDGVTDLEFDSIASPTSKKLKQAEKEKTQAISIVFKDSVVQKAKHELELIVFSLSLSVDDLQRVQKILGYVFKRVEYYYQFAVKRFDDFNKMEYVSDIEVDAEVKDIKAYFINRLPESLRASVGQAEKNEIASTSTSSLSARPN